MDQERTGKFLKVSGIFQNRFPVGDWEEPAGSGSFD